MGARSHQSVQVGRGLAPWTPRTVDVSTKIGGCIILYINSRTQKLYLIKVNAYLFTALLLLVLTKINIIYYEYVEFSPFVYIFALFLIVFTIPWRAIEVIPLTFMHLAAYTSIFLYIQKAMAHSPELNFSFSTYLEGLTFLFIACTILHLL